MSAPFLILHKVRGEPAFDIAVRMECPVCRDGGAPCEDDKCDGGFWWIVATSGHRAYPYQTWDMKLVGLEGFYDEGFHELIWELHPNREGWATLPDHFSLNDPREARVTTTTASALLAKIGLGPKPMKRRQI